MQVFFVRGGRNNGNRAFFPTHAKTEEAAEVLAAFIAPVLRRQAAAALVLLSHTLPEQELVAEALSLKAGRKVEILVPQRGEKRAVVQHAETNAREALERKLAESAGAGEAAARVSPSCSACRRRPSASRSTTTATSWAPTPTA